MVVLLGRRRISAVARREVEGKVERVGVATMGNLPGGEV